MYLIVTTDPVAEEFQFSDPRMTYIEDYTDDDGNAVFVYEVDAPSQADNQDLDNDDAVIAYRWATEY
jgi:hypothetical protein